MKFKLANSSDLDVLIAMRLEMLREVNQYSFDYEYPEKFVDETQYFFTNGSHASVLVYDEGMVVGCGTLCFTYVMPTPMHPTGKRAHLMNVYTKPAYRHAGVGKRIVEMLISEAAKKGVTEVYLDATKDGRPLYEALGFTARLEGMTLLIPAD